MGVLTSAWNYNAIIQAWEPILEPWKLIFKMDINTSGIVWPSLFVQIMLVSPSFHVYMFAWHVVPGVAKMIVCDHCRWHMVWPLAPTSASRAPASSCKSPWHMQQCSPSSEPSDNGESCMLLAPMRPTSASLQLQTLPVYTHTCSTHWACQLRCSWTLGAMCK